MKLLQLLGFEGAGDPPRSDIEGVRTIVDVLRTLPPERARHLAAFAYILSRIAHVDRQVSNAETTAIERIVAEHGKLPESQAIEHADYIAIRLAHKRHLGVLRSDP